MVRARSLSLLVRLALVTLPLAALPACGEDLPTFPPSARDSGIECVSAPTPSRDGGPMSMMDGGGLPPVDGGGAGGGGAALTSGCESGEVCLQGHCYPGCAGDADCTAHEQCTAGVCVPRTMPRADMGMPDLGVTDLCAGVTCADPTPHCYPRTGTCVQCETGADCGAAAPVCDVAYGVCRAFVPAQCAPCKLDLDCTGAISTFEARCLQRDEPFERVCIARCGSDGSCPQGTQCDLDTSNCLPFIGTCTTFFAASQHRACSVDEECAPLGSTTSDFLFPGSCRASACAAPCGMTGAAVECPDATQSCDGTFCAP